MSENKEVRTEKKQLRTRCYYSDYVNHAIRFYLTCPDTLQTAGKRKADILNWMSVQAVFHRLKDEDKAALKEIYQADHKVSEGVRMYCERTGTDATKMWVLITKVSAAIAKGRGLV